MLFFSPILSWKIFILKIKNCVLLVYYESSSLSVLLECTKSTFDSIS